MNEDFKWEPDEQNLSTNDTLYTDFIAQLVSSWFTSNTKIIGSVCRSIGNDIAHNPSGMPGLLFGCMLHITTLIEKIATEKGISARDAWSQYLEEYNTDIRLRMANISILHPNLADKFGEALFKEDE